VQLAPDPAPYSPCPPCLQTLDKPALQRLMFEQVLVRECRYPFGACLRRLHPLPPPPVRHCLQAYHPEAAEASRK
jgi:hypothetical protein